MSAPRGVLLARYHSTPVWRTVRTVHVTQITNGPTTSVDICAHELGGAPKILRYSMDGVRGCVNWR